jgi:ceramide glucosyltransferase
VLKPLHGAEPGLDENLRSFVDQDYPSLQVVFGVQSPEDEALQSTRKLIAERPSDDIAVVVDPRARGSNLKIANLENMLPSARHDVLVLADSDMRVGRTYLAEVTAPLLDPAVGIVTCLYKGVGTGGPWSELGAMHINFGFLPSALLAEVMGWGGGCFGATVALRRQVLERIGGFARLRDELADDHRIGSAVRELGLKTHLSRYIVEDRVSEPTFGSLWRHELRWARTTRLMAPGGFAGSVATHTMVIAILAAFATGLSAAGCMVLLISCLLRWGSAAAIARMFGLPLGNLWLLPVRDALSFVVFIASFCGRSVSWRDQVFQVDQGGRMTAAEGDKPV